MRWLMLTGFLWCTLVQAGLPASLQEALLKAQVPTDSVAVVVQPLDGGAPLISHRATQAMNPASVMKLVTTYAALEALTPAYRWKTEIYGNGPLKQGMLDGDLVIKGYGDPALNMAEFWRLLQQLRQQGVRHIRGNLILDTSVYMPGVSQRPVLDDEPWRAYNASPSALLLNGRHSSFRFSVDTRPVQPAVMITPEFPLPQIRIVNSMQVRPGACQDWRADLHYAVKPEPAGVTVTFSGSLPAQCDERYLELSVFSDAQYVYYSFKQLWAQLGGQFDGQWLSGTATDAMTLLTTWWSPPLDAVVRDINKWSNNVMARQLMLTVGMEAGLLPADEPTAALALKEVLRQRGLSFPELVLENGSGLSRKERISAEHLAQLLVTAYQRPVMPVLMASMPIIGMDGTTKRRLASSPDSGMAYLKTGSLEGVSSIAGYVQSLQGKRYAVVMLVNHPHAAAARAAQDGLLKALIEAE